MCLVVALSISLITIMSDSKQVLVSATLVALVVTTKELVIIWIEFQKTALDNLIGILHSLFQTAVSL